MTETRVAQVLERLDAIQEVMTARRVFGEAYELDGLSVIPVAAVRGGGGGGSGEGTGVEGAGGEGTGVQERPGSGAGAGMGFGVNVRPVGVYVVKDGTVSWQPAVDVMRIVLGAQVVALLGFLSVSRALRRRRRSRRR